MTSAGFEHTIFTLLILLDTRSLTPPKPGYQMEFQLPAPPPGMGGPPPGGDQPHPDHGFLQALTGPEELQGLPQGHPFGPHPFGPPPPPLDIRL